VTSEFAKSVGVFGLTAVAERSGVFSQAPGQARITSTEALRNAEKFPGHRIRQRQVAAKKSLVAPTKNS
jgi:hypothetical protein